LRSKKLKYAALALFVIAVGLVVFHRPILGGAGRFMAPVREEKAEVLVLEGVSAIDVDVLHTGGEALVSRKGEPHDSGLFISS
jgi:hypothetical protein